MVDATPTTCRDWFHEIECSMADVDGLAQAIMFIELGLDTSDPDYERLACLLRVLRLHAEGVARRGNAAIQAAMNAGAHRVGDAPALDELGEEDAARGAA